MAEEAVDELEEQNHATLKIWLAIVLGSLLLSNAVMSVVLLNPGATGFIAFDTGPNPEFNPNFVGEEEYSSHISTTLVFGGVLIALQVGIYMMVTRFYRQLEE